MNGAKTNFKRYMEKKELQKLHGEKKNLERYMEKELKILVNHNTFKHSMNQKK